MVTSMKARSSLASFEVRRRVVRLPRRLQTPGCLGGHQTGSIETTRRSRRGGGGGGGGGIAKGVQSAIQKKEIRGEGRGWSCACAATSGQENEKNNSDDWQQKYEKAVNEDLPKFWKEFRKQASLRYGKERETERERECVCVCVLLPQA